MKCFKCCKTRSNGTPLLQNVTINFCVCFTEQRDISYVTNQPDSSTVKVSNNGEVYRKYMSQENNCCCQLSIFIIVVFTFHREIAFEKTAMFNIETKSLTDILISWSKINFQKNVDLKNQKFPSLKHEILIWLGRFQRVSQWVVIFLQGIQLCL